MYTNSLTIDRFVCQYNQMFFFSFSSVDLQVIRSSDLENWTLQIKFSQARDSGIYECQVNTEPKMSMAFRLNIVGKWLLGNFIR